MTKIITRFFESADQARLVKGELEHRYGFPNGILAVYDSAEGAADALTRRHVEAGAAQAYQSRLAGGGAVLLVEATYKPLGVARIYRDVTADMGAVDMGDITQEVTVREDPASLKGNLLKGNPRLLTRPLDSSEPKSNHYMADWPIPLIIRRPPPDETAKPDHGLVTESFFSMISRRKPNDNFAFPRHARMANFPLPLISKRKPFTGSIFPRHARMANFPIGLISKRKPYTGTLIGRHSRMANWPFPHLINGKRGTNALVPGQPHMANFPISLISKREPYTGSAIPRHGRMANFPIPLISKRKPYDGFAIPRHGRMADTILPLIVRRSEDTTESKDSGFSFSKMLGLRTVIRR